MLEELVATRFAKPMTSGRTGPILLAGETPDGEEIEVIAKFSKGGDIGALGLGREALCAMLAADLGMPVPKPHLVRLDAEFIKVVGTANPGVAQLLAQSIPVGFASTKLPPGYAVWMRDRKIPASMKQMAAEIFAFDMMITNPDRRPDNPNLLWKGEQFAIFDHELALSGAQTLFWKPPWEQGALTDSAGPEKHVLGAGLQGFVPDLKRLTGAWEAISDARLQQYVAALPAEWDSVKNSTNDAILYLSRLRHNIQLAVQEVLRVLQ